MKLYMKVYLKALKLYFQIVSLFSPTIAGNQAARLFQKTQPATFRKKEKELYDVANSFTVFHQEENIEVYELGDPNGKLVILVHGWNSNAGSMTAIAKKLAALGHRVLAFDLPAHGKSKLTHTHLLKVSQAFHSVLAQVNPQEPFSVVAHSFGSAASAYTLSVLNFEIDKLVFLTSPYKIETIFMEFARQIGLGKKAFKAMVPVLEEILKKPMNRMHIPSLTQQISYQKLIVIHDKFDRVLPFKNTEAFENVNDDCEIIPLEKTGHYRMLWDSTVLEIMGDAFAQKKKLKRI